MILSIVASLFSAALVTQVSSQEISLTIEIRETKLRQRSLGRRVQFPTNSGRYRYRDSGVRRRDRGRPEPGNLKVAITDLDGETSLESFKEVQMRRATVHNSNARSP